MRRTLLYCPKDQRRAAHKGLFQPILEYGSSVFDSHYDNLIDKLENVQKRATKITHMNKKVIASFGMASLKSKTGIPAEKND